MRTQISSQEQQPSVQEVRQCVQSVNQTLNQLRDQTTSVHIREWIDLAQTKFNAGLSYAERVITQFNAENQTNQFISDEQRQRRQPQTA